MNTLNVDARIVTSIQFTRVSHIRKTFEITYLIFGSPDVSELRKPCQIENSVSDFHCVKTNDPDKYSGFRNPLIDWGTTKPLGEKMNHPGEEDESSE